VSNLDVIINQNTLLYLRIEALRFNPEEKRFYDSFHGLDDCRIRSEAHTLSITWIIILIWSPNTRP